MPKPGVLLLLILVVTGGVVLGRSDPDPQPGVRPERAGRLIAPAAGHQPDTPIGQFGDRGWMQRTLTVATDSPAGPIEVVVELRFSWSDGAGHVRVVGSETSGRYEEVITDEPRLGSDLDESLEHYQRMLDELRSSGGSIVVVDGVTVARQRILTPDGEAVDVWRIGGGDPEW